LRWKCRDLLLLICFIQTVSRSQTGLPQVKFSKLSALCCLLSLSETVGDHYAVFLAEIA
jgi:hypothetical protein